MLAILVWGASVASRTQALGSDRKCQEGSILISSCDPHEWLGLFSKKVHIYKPGTYGKINQRLWYCVYTRSLRYIVSLVQKQINLSSVDGDWKWKANGELFDTTIWCKQFLNKQSNLTTLKHNVYTL